MSSIRRFVILVVVLFFAQSSALPAEPATSPTSAPATRRVRVVPPGFISLQLFDREILCTDAEAQSLRKLIVDIAPATRPTTVPLDLLTAFEAMRPGLVKMIADDLALEDTASVDAWLTKELHPRLQNLSTLEPPVCYLFTTREQLKEIVKGGWGGTNFRYNKVADDVAVNVTLEISTEHEADDAVLPVLFDASASPTERAEHLKKTIQEAEAKLMAALARRAMEVTQLGFIQLIGELGTAPLDLKRDQLWWGMGAASLLSAKYTADITGIARRDIMKQLISDHPRNPIKMARIDLLHPTAETDLRNEVVPFYSDAMRRKSASVLWAWNQSTGDRRIGQVFMKLRETKPLDGAGIVSIIKELSGTDLTAELASK